MQHKGADSEPDQNKRQGQAVRQPALSPVNRRREGEEESQDQCEGNFQVGSPWVVEADLRIQLKDFLQRLRLTGCFTKLDAGLPLLRHHHRFSVSVNRNPAGNIGCRDLPNNG